MIYSLFESPWCLFVPEFWNKPKKIILFINENNTKTPKIRTHDWEKKVSSIDAHANHYASAPGWAASRIDLGFLICVLSDSAGRESEWEIEFLLCPIVDTETVTTQGRLDWFSWFFACIFTRLRPSSMFVILWRKSSWPFSPKLWKFISHKRINRLTWFFVW